MRGLARLCDKLKHISAITMLIAIKLGRVVTYNEKLPLLTFLDPSIMWFYEVTRQIKYIATCTRSMTTKHGKVVTYREGLLPINSHNPLNMWSCEVT